MAETAATLFCDRLFELDPALRPCFKGDIQDQGRKQMQTLAVAVAGLDDLGVLALAVRALGRRTWPAASATSTTRRWRVPCS